MGRTVKHILIGGAMQKKSIAAVIFSYYKCMQWNIFISDDALKLVWSIDSQLQKEGNKILQYSHLVS